MSSVRTTRRSFLASGLALGGTVAALPAAVADATRPTAAQPTTPDQALRRLVQGNQRFQRGKMSSLGVTARRAELVEGQAPFAVILGCADSRLPPELVFDQGLGDLFTVRVAGNTATAPVVVGSVEYSTAVLSSPLVVVLGHDDCGAVKAAIDVVTKGKEFPGELGGFIEPIIPAVVTAQGTNPTDLLDAAVSENVRQTVADLSRASLLESDVAAGKLKVVGAEYRLHSGKVDLLD